MKNNRVDAPLAANPAQGVEAWLGEGDGFKSFTRSKATAEKWRRGGIKVTSVFAAIGTGGQAVDAPAVKALTTHEMADALGCFWNAALGEAHNKQDSTAFAVASIMAEGFAAVERRLREFSTLTPAPSQPDGEIERFHFTRRDGFTTIQLHADETFVRLSDYERLKFALKTAKTEAEYLAGKVERAESRAEALSKELADHLQARFDLELDAYAKDSDMAALRSLVAEYLKLHPDIHKGLNYCVRDTATANRLSELAGKARSLLNGEKAK